MAYRACACRSQWFRALSPAPSTAPESVPWSTHEGRTLRANTASPVSLLPERFNPWRAVRNPSVSGIGPAVTGRNGEVRHETATQGTGGDDGASHPEHDGACATIRPMSIACFLLDNAPPRTETVSEISQPRSPDLWCWAANNETVLRLLKKLVRGQVLARGTAFAAHKLEVPVLLGCIHVYRARATLWIDALPTRTCKSPRSIRLGEKHRAKHGRVSCLTVQVVVLKTQQR